MSPKEQRQTEIGWKRSVAAKEEEAGEGWTGSPDEQLQTAMQNGQQQSPTADSAVYSCPEELTKMKRVEMKNRRN